MTGLLLGVVWWLALRMTEGTNTPGRRFPVWAWVVIVVVAAFGLVTAPVWAPAVGIIGFAASGPSSEQERHARLKAADEVGARACSALDAYLVAGWGSLEQVQTQAAGAGTVGIREAAGLGAQELRVACVQAGANMSDPTLGK